MDFADLTPEQQEKARACKTPEDILALAETEGYELSEEELEGVSGGFLWIDDCDEDTGGCESKWGKGWGEH